MTTPLTCTLVGTVKDEGPYLLEWVCYYKLIGFTQIVIASNDCSDGTREMLDHLHQLGEIIHLENSAAPEDLPRDPQNRAYHRAWHLDVVQQSDWVLVADADEFLNIHTGNGSLAALFTALADFNPNGIDLIAAPWRVFGNAGIAPFEDAPIIAQFDHAARLGVHKTQRFTAFKTLFRPKFVGRMGVHRPRLKPRFRDGLRPCKWVNGSGDLLPERYLNQGWRLFADTYGASLVTMNHYMIKSSEAFLMKRYRGTANSADEDRIDFSYFDTFNANDVVEKSIQRHVPALHKVLSDIVSKHPRLRELHENSLAFHRKKLAVARENLQRDQPEILAKLGL